MYSVDRALPRQEHRPPIGADAGCDARTDRSASANEGALVAQVAAGVLVYVASALVLLRSSVCELLRLGRDALRRHKRG